MEKRGRKTGGGGQELNVCGAETKIKYRCDPIHILLNYSYYYFIL